jgi:hypothetical protein
MKSLLQIMEVRFHLQVRVVIAKTSFNLIEIIETIVEIKVRDDGMGLLGILIEPVGRRRIGNHGLVHLLHQVDYGAGTLWCKSLCDFFIVCYRVAGSTPINTAGQFLI